MQVLCAQLFTRGHGEHDAFFAGYVYSTPDLSWIWNWTCASTTRTALHCEWKWTQCVLCWICLHLEPLQRSLLYTGFSWIWDWAYAGPLRTALYLEWRRTPCDLCRICLHLHFLHNRTVRVWSPKAGQRAPWKAQAKCQKEWTKHVQVLRAQLFA